VKRGIRYSQEKKNKKPGKIRQREERNFCRLYPGDLQKLLIRTKSLKAIRRSCERRLVHRNKRGANQIPAKSWQRQGKDDVQTKRMEGGAKKIRRNKKKKTLDDINLKI